MKKSTMEEKNVRNNYGLDKHYFWLFMLMTIIITIHVSIYINN